MALSRLASIFGGRPVQTAGYGWVRQARCLSGASWNGLGARRGVSTEDSPAPVHVLSTSPSLYRLAREKPPVQFPVHRLTADDSVVRKTALPSGIFKAPVRVDLIHRVVVWQRAKKRSGTATAKTRSEVQGSTRKPWKQKGTGRARVGSIRSPLWRGGGVVFPPQIRSYDYALPKKVRRRGLLSAIAARFKERNVVVLEDDRLESSKTKDLLGVLRARGWEDALLIGGSELDENLKLASSNMFKFNVLPWQGANVYSILKHERLLLTLDAVDGLAKRLLDAEDNQRKTNRM